MKKVHTTFFFNINIVKITTLTLQIKNKKQIKYTTNNKIEKQYKIIKRIITNIKINKKINKLIDQ